MTALKKICEHLEQFAPPRLAEDWDNVGLLVGDPQHDAERIMTCLTITPVSADEAVREKADLIVTHHPLPFRSLKRLTTDSTPGRLLLQLVRAGVAVYSPHTAFDSAAAGINQQLAEGLGLSGILPLVAKTDEASGLGAGRCGSLPQATTLAKLAGRLKAFLHLDGLHVVGPAEQRLERVAVACGAAGEFLEPARQAGCDALVTGETTFHTCLEAEAQGMAMLLPGHFASERFAVVRLAEQLAAQFPELYVWASRQECDPLRWV
ncbi:MAG: Nif3-like dinuclear metal center hexameric protein [Candidatus Anammoximicrobium sp.]|nr:Nif3-like dinuclear metal center hexameric protein [Candidatus Anammoximicrobium sp.]